MSLPPFELVYHEHRDELYGFLRGRLTENDAADAFQDTFLRALRTYPGLTHGNELRAWLYTIARSVLADRARRASVRPQEVAATDGIEGESDRARTGDRAGSDPASLVAETAALESLTNELPPTERAAVVLRYGFDLSYEQIGSALDTSSDAARQATSSGVRRIRRSLDDTSQHRDKEGRP